MPGTLTGKTAVITGGARGQGRSHALKLAGEGANVALLDLTEDIATCPYPLGNPTDLKETVEMVTALGVKCEPYTIDVRDGAGMKATVNDVASEFGSVDILLANAGIFSWGPIEEMSDETWRDMIDINLTGIFNSFRAVAPHMREPGKGRVIATASMAGRGGFAQIAHYTAAKWGLIGLSKSFALEMVPFGTTVNVVAPTNTNTLMIQNDKAWAFFSPDDPTPAGAAAGMASMTPMGIPFVEPEDISNAIAFLVSDAARYVTGEVLHVSAGMSATNAV